MDMLSLVELEFLSDFIYGLNDFNVCLLSGNKGRQDKPVTTSLFIVSGAEFKTFIAGFIYICTK